MLLGGTFKEVHAENLLLCAPKYWPITEEPWHSFYFKTKMDF